MTPQDAATLKALGDGVTHAGREAERKWGVGRLPLLVSAEWREKFERQLATWREALDDAYAAGGDGPAPNTALDALRGAASGVERAWGKLDRLATEGGSAAISGDVWEAVRHDGAVIAICPTTADACKVVTEGRYVACYTLEEVANIIAALPAALQQVKQEWPGARVVPERSTGRSRVMMDDPIPF